MDGAGIHPCEIAANLGIASLTVGDDGDGQRLVVGFSEALLQQLVPEKSCENHRTMMECFRMCAKNKVAVEDT
jgi:hypothetical protein